MKRPTILELLAVFALFAAALVIRGFDFSALIAFPDDFTYASRTYQLVGQNWVWPTSQMWDQPPLMVYVLGVAFTLFGGALDTLRWVSVIAGSLSVIVAYYLGKSMYGRKAGFIGAFALTINGFTVLYSRLIYIEALASLLILAATYFFWEGLVKKRDMKKSLAGGVAFGLALDAKYVSLVMGVALVVFLLFYRNKLKDGFPPREAAAYFGVGFLCTLPVLLDLAISNVNPFYWDLVTRFQMAQSSSFVGTVASGSFITLGYTHFVTLLFHVSSTNPFQVFPLIMIDIPLWNALVAIVVGFFIIAFFMRRSTADGLLLILFLALLAFAFTYPDRRSYFLIYPAVLFFVMAGRVGQLAIEGSSLRRRNLTAVGSMFVLGLMVSGLAINTAAVPYFYQNGFGDWDEIAPIVNYIGLNHSPNSYVATTRLQVAVYLFLNKVNVTIAFMRGPANYNFLPVLNQTLTTPYRGTFPTYWVISANAIEKTHPQFLVISLSDYNSLTAEFHRYINERYYRPLDTSLVLLFQVRPESFTGQA